MTHSKEWKEKWVTPEIEHGKLTEYNFLVHYPEGLKLGRYVDLSQFVYIQARGGVEIRDKLKEELDELCFPDLLERQRKNEIIDKIMGNFNHSPQDNSKKISHLLNNLQPEDTHVKKINGVEYISKDVHNTIFVDFVKKLKEEINKGLHKGNCSCDRCDARRQDLFDITKIMGEIKK